MPAPQVILDLVARFRDNEDAYRRDYGETETRREFLDPYFKALGWDIDNTSGNAEAYKDVVHEDSVKVGFSMKAPDYSFRVGGVRKFFLEAKKPAVNIKEDSDPAFQLRRYAWSAKLPLSILSNFAEFAVYDCRVRPKQAEKAGAARTMYLTYKDYAAHWDEITAIFSKDALYKGSFDKYAAGKGKKGIAEVDDAFLEEIERWRDSLAHNIALRNSKLAQPELNFAVQQTIDRIIFLRICEDRGIEPYGRLQGLQNGENVYGRLKQFFHHADERYNSGLFHFREEKGRLHPDELTLQLKIDDKVLKDILGGLYYPESPYEFSVLPADILGQVYEQFLGKVIRLTAGGHAKVEDKPEVKKAGGVYYTPTYIVGYIVKETVGRLLQGSTPDKATKLKILDPACGSGSFLLGAYQCILDWHRDWYSANDPEKHARGRPPRIFKGPGGGWRLTTAERKRILLNNIYGVDIDAQAVEVTKLSLLLRVLEEESGETLNKNWEMFHERALPDLDSNIKCGNSLIGPDFFGGRLDLGDEERRHINPFDWEAEFPEIVKRKPGKESGGFDAVIGNPPYVRIQRISEAESDYLFKSYESPTSKMDLSLVFLEKGLKLINKLGRAGFICTSQWLTTIYGKNLRRMLASGHLHEIIDFGSLPVFQNADTYPAIFCLSSVAARELTYKRITTTDQLNLKGIETAPAASIGFSSLTDAPWSLGGLDIVGILTSCELQWGPLRDFGKAYIGTKSGMNDAFVLPKNDANRLGLEKALLFPYAHRGEEIGRYRTVGPGSVVIYPYREGLDGDSTLISETELKKSFPCVYAHLSSFKDQLRKRKDSRRLYATGPDWHRHLRAGSFHYIRPTKLVLKGIAKRPEVGLLQENTAFDGARCPAIILENLNGHHRNYVLGVLNSRVLAYFLRRTCPPKLSGYVEFSATALGSAPIRVINFGDQIEKDSHDRIVLLVEQMLLLHERIDSERAPHAKTAIQRQIAAADREIDELVYKLYGLTEDQIRSVEQGDLGEPTTTREEARSEIRLAS